MSGHSYWKTIFLLCVSGIATAIGSSAQTFTTLFNFDGTDGSYPFGVLVQGVDGKLYGTTGAGGASDACSAGCGTVLEISTGGKLNSLDTFDDTDGSSPIAGLAQATDGNFYGTTEWGGPSGVGTVFKITPTGVRTTLHGFCTNGDCMDGEEPEGALVQAASGNLYGTASEGGANHAGTVFEITPAGKLTTIHSFCAETDCTDGSLPVAGLVQATNGDFYGTTEFGGANRQGVVFEITAGGNLTTLYSFCSQAGCTDGSGPTAPLVQATNGNFYGTTAYGGADICAEGCGTVFQITPEGKLTTLHSFCSESGCADGFQPLAGLVQGTDGAFYGTTYGGGASGFGTVFRITAQGELHTLYSFCAQTNCTDGTSPYAGLIQGTDGNIYGTTLYGGANNDGTVFSLEVGLGPFVETLPTSGKIGSTVNILGNNLRGATSVNFNGTAAPFMVKSNSEISTTVPPGATTGRVEVVTASGTLTSNTSFRVE